MISDVLTQSSERALFLTESDFKSPVELAPGVEIAGADEVEQQCSYLCEVGEGGFEYGDQTV